jgi:hypothetical protein
MNPTFKVGDMVTWIGQDKIGTVAEVLQARADAEPLYSIKYGSELRSAREGQLKPFPARNHVEKELGFDELKRQPFTKIQVDGGPSVSFLTWQGVSPFAAGGPGDINMVHVRYFLDGNRLRTRRDVSHEEVWYTLS